MTRRCTMTLAVLAAALVLAGRPALVKADPIGTYTLVNNTGGPIDGVVLQAPDGSLWPSGTDPNAPGAPPLPIPLNIITQGSSGFGTDNKPIEILGGLFPNLSGDGLAVAFNGTDPTQYSAVPLANGGVFNFSLNLDPGYNLAKLGPPQLQLAPGSLQPSGSTAGVELLNPTPAPEPLSVAVWSALTGIGLIQARRTARRKATA